MPSEEPKETDLTRALESARQNPGHANFFFDAFLNWNLCVPVRKEGTEVGTWSRLALKETFYPLFVPQGELRLVPVFDSLERLKLWANQRQLDYIELRAHQFLKMLAGQVALTLNPNTPWNHVFSPEVIQRLITTMKVVHPA